jgi:hypothetical protein
VRLAEWGVRPRRNGPYTGHDGARRILSVQPVNPYLRALLRFWWVLALGLALASVAAVAMVYRIDFSSVPPKLSERTPPLYATTARVLVTSSEVPYLRISLTRPVETPLPGSAQPALPAVEERPDIGILVRVANLYPLLLESDEVAELREEMFGPLPGNVRAQGVFSFVNQNRYEPTTLPVIEIFAVSDTAAGAVAIAQGTVEAFRRYILNQQNRAGLRPNERILLEPLQQPRAPIATGGSSLALPVLVLFALLAAFAVFALLLDRIFPPVRTQGASIEPLDRRVRVSDTA